MYEKKIGIRIGNHKKGQQTKTSAEIFSNCVHLQTNEGLCGLSRVEIPLKHDIHQNLVDTVYDNVNDQNSLKLRISL